MADDLLSFPKEFFVKLVLLFSALIDFQRAPQVLDLSFQFGDPCFVRVDLGVEVTVPNLQPDNLLLLFVEKFVVVAIVAGQPEFLGE